MAAPGGSTSHRGAPLVQAGHRQHIAAALVCAAGIGGALTALLSIADAQFLSRVGSRHLGSGFALSSAVSMVLLWKLGSLADRRDRASLLYAGSWIAVTGIVVLALASSVVPKLVAVALLVASKQIGASLELLLWVVIADRFTARQARRVLPWIIVAHGAGGALGALAVAPTAQGFGAIAPMWLAAGLLAIVALSAQRLTRAPDYRRSRSALTPPPSESSTAMQVLRARPLARWLALLVACAGIFAPMMYYLVGVSAAAEYRDEVELAGFLGNYRAYVQGAALVAQLVIAPRLAQRLGVGPLLLLAPLGAVIAAVFVGLEGGLLVILLAQAAARILDAAIQSPSEQLVQNLLPQEVRGRVAGVLGGVAKRSGTIVGGLAASMLIVWPSVFTGALLLAALLWLVVATLLWRRFAELAVGELSAATTPGGLPGSDAARQLGDPRGLHRLRGLLASGHARERDNALALLTRLAELGKVNALDELLAVLDNSPHPDALQQAIWLRLGDGALGNASAVQKAMLLLDSARASQVELGFAILSTAPDLSVEQRERVVERARAAQGLAARVALLRLEGEPILSELAGAGHTSAVMHQLRCEIARAARGQSSDAADDLAERLLRTLARSSEPALQVAALDSVIAAMGDPENSAMSMLLGARLAELSARWRDSPLAVLREASLVAQSASNAPDLRALVTALGDREESVRRCAEKLLRVAGDDALAVLSIASQSGRRRIRLAAVELLADLRPSADALDVLLQQELAEMTRCSQHAGKLAQLPTSSLLQRRLHERVHEAVEAALLALAARASQRTRGAAIAEVARRLARAASERSRARALEALDALLPRKIAHTMLGAIEGRSDGKVSLRSAIESELAGRDPLTRDLLVQALGRENRASFREHITEAASVAARAVDPMRLVERLVAGDRDTVAGEVPGTLETIVALSELPLFAELSTIQLEELARVVVWQSQPAGATLMHEGEEGHCMYFVRSGSLHVLVQGQRVATLGPGEPVGELALFAEDRRTATVVVSEDAELGVLTREDIENLVEEVPGIALQLCRAMSRRLAEANRSGAA